MNILQHLKDRHLDVDLHAPVVDSDNGVATFYLWNPSGQIVGYQQYRPLAGKDRKNDPKEGRYFTIRNHSTLAVWGVESLHLTPNVLFVTEGIFDAARLTKKGVSAIAVLSNNPTADLKNWLVCLNKTVVVVADNDTAGQKLVKFGDYHTYTKSDKDLGDCSDSEVDDIISAFIAKP